MLAERVVVGGGVEVHRPVECVAPGDRRDVRRLPEERREHLKAVVNIAMQHHARLTDVHVAEHETKVLLVPRVRDARRPLRDLGRVDIPLAVRHDEWSGGGIVHERRMHCAALLDATAGDPRYAAAVVTRPCSHPRHRPGGERIRGVGAGRPLCSDCHKPPAIRGPADRAAHDALAASFHGAPDCARVPLGQRLRGIAKRRQRDPLGRVGGQSMRSTAYARWV